MILLTDEEIKKATEQTGYVMKSDTGKLIIELSLKAHLKKLYDWGNEPCLKHFASRFHVPRRSCTKCWSELKEG